MNHSLKAILAASGILLAVHPALAAEGDATRGQRIFGACAPCHSLEPNKNMTGPSLGPAFGTGKPENYQDLTVTRPLSKIQGSFGETRRLMRGSPIRRSSFPKTT